jgi:predicted anti-sigma-YlaC factor YlaD
MNTPDHTLYSDLLNLEIDGLLTREQQAHLDDHLVTCADCRAERAQLVGLADLLLHSQVPVEPGFRDRVLTALPAAGWESRHPRTWALPAAACVALLGAGIAVLGAGSARMGSAYGVFAALAGMLQAALVAGIGFTTASWRWCGMFVHQLLGSPMSLVMFGVFVLSLNLLLVSLVRRRRVPVAASGERNERGERHERSGARSRRSGSSL